MVSKISPVSVSLCGFWRWGWMEPHPLRGESGSEVPKENGAQWMTTIGAWRQQLWYADSWSVELPLMLPERLILDQGLAPFGFSIFTAMGQSQCSRSVVIPTIKTILLKAFPMTGMEQSAQVSPVCSKEWIPSRKIFIIFLGIAWEYGSAAFVLHSWVKTPVTQWFLEC